uniref:Orphan G-protein coupled receptor 25 n=1 Tax=Platynereis dumerilii TaxID=6359 RepID=A0A0K0PUH8_PLADU|nr:orphan G-protein coupled receptor 25 [Platynereis dumerilii]
MKTVTNLYFANLAIADLLFLLLSIPYTFINHFMNSWPFGEFLCHLTHIGMTTTNAICVMTLVAMGIDRYTAVVKPMAARTARTVHRAALLLGIVWIIGILTSLPVRYFSHLNPRSGLCEHYFPGDETLARKIFNIVNFLVYYAIPLAIIAFCYCSTSRKLRQRMQNTGGGRAKGDAEKRNRKVNRITITVVATFAACWLPIYAYNFYADSLLVSEYDMPFNNGTGGHDILMYNHIVPNFDAKFGSDSTEVDSTSTGSSVQSNLRSKPDVDSNMQAKPRSKFDSHSPFGSKLGADPSLQSGYGSNKGVGSAVKSDIRNNPDLDLEFQSGESEGSGLSNNIEPKVDFEPEAVEDTGSGSDDGRNMYFNNAGYGPNFDTKAEQNFDTEADPDFSSEAFSFATMKHIILIISQFLQYVNSALNPLIYSAMCSKFKESFHQTFCRSCTCYVKRKSGTNCHHTPSASPIPAKNVVQRPQTRQTSSKEIALLADV